MSVTEKFTSGGCAMYGLSTDEKPTVLQTVSGNQEVPNASTFYEMDTGKLFMYDTDSNTWLEQ